MPNARASAPQAKWTWALEATVILTAMPAVLSPLILGPLPAAWNLPAVMLSPIVQALQYPYAWAAVATVITALRMRAGAVSTAGKILGAVIVLLAWVAAFHTASRLSDWSRF